jgi:integrase/recombinase XerD
MLTRLVESYIEMRHACGLSFRIQGCLLKRFATFSDAQGEPFIRASTAIKWAEEAPSVYQSARRLGDVIRLARYLRAEDPRHELPAAVFGSQHRPRRVPYIFSGEDIRRLVHEVSQSGYRTLRRETYATLFSLLACTGLRVSEAIHLRYNDITQDGLIVRNSKFRRSRLIPLHETTRVALERYIEKRRPYAPLDAHVFISLRRKPLRLGDVDRAFRLAADKIGLLRGPGLPQPTPHSLRHTFSVRALENGPTERDRVTRHTLALSTYLGHSSAAGTYWYLQGTSQLLKSVAERCERFVSEGGQS